MFCCMSTPEQDRVRLQFPNLLRLPPPHESKCRLIQYLYDQDIEAELRYKSLWDNEFSDQSTRVEEYAINVCVKYVGSEAHESNRVMFRHYNTLLLEK